MITSNVASIRKPLGSSNPTTLIATVLATAGLLVLSLATPAWAEPTLTEDSTPDLLTTVGGWEKASQLGSDAAVRGLAVEIQSDLLERGTDRFRFQDFHARAFEAELERLDHPMPGGTTWIGRVTEFGEHSEVLLSTYGGAVSGYLDTPEARYEIQPRPGGHVMVELDPSRFAGCGTEDEDGDHDHDITAEQRREAATTLGLDPSSLDSQVDGKASLFSILEIAVLFTEEVEETVGGSEGLFSTVFSALGVLNQSFFNSAIPAMAQLVGLEETEQLGNTAAGYDGLALVLFGDGSEFSTENELELYENRPDFDGQSENGDSFGQAMARGDFDNDGYDDLAIGVPGETLSSGTFRSAGLVWILYGSADGFDFDRTRKFHQNSSGMPDSNESGDLFGWSLAVGNFDGDQHDDLAIGVPYETVGGHEDAGRVQILYGTGGGLTTNGSLSIDQDDLSGEASEEDDHFGWALTSGDFDDDGYDDLAIGTPDQDRTVGANTTHSVGRVAVVYGSQDGLDPDESDAFEQGSSGVGDSPESWDRLGAVLASGDFDDDGYDDLAMGVPFDNQASGLVQILFGTASGLTGTDSSTLTHSDAGGVAADRDNFGASLAVGDLNGDSIDDLVVGVPLKDKGDKEDAGEVNLFYGRSPWTVTAGSRIQGIQDNAQFGYALATADLDGDGYDDLLASEPYYDYKRDKKAEEPNAGQVWVINGGANTLSIGGTWAQQTAGVAGSPEKNDLFGYVLLLGDFDDDGNPDLVAGVPAEGVSNDSDYFKKWLGAKSRVAEFREETGADLVGLLVEDLEDACGSAQDIPETTAGDSTVYYQVTDRSCAVGHMTFAHEIGHLIGLGHNPGKGGGTCDDAHGHFVDQKGRTVMSYLDDCTGENCPREARFSDPDLDFSFGDPTGIDGDRDNARCARLTVPNVAAYN